MAKKNNNKSPAADEKHSGKTSVVERRQSRRRKTDQFGFQNLDSENPESPDKGNSTASKVEKLTKLVCVNDDCPITRELATLRAELEKLRAQVVHDHLTGLFNARQFESSLSQEMERTLRSRQPTTLIIVDIDHFKKVNDTYGHAVGDIVLRKVAQILKKSTRKLDTCCRYGGEEFIIILPSTHLLIGVQVAERIRATLENTAIDLTEGEVSITASFGVACFHYNSRLDQGAFFRLADEQLYRAKKSGRNLVCHAPHEESSGPSVSIDERAALFSDPESGNNHSNS